MIRDVEKTSRVFIIENEFWSKKYYMLLKFTDTKSKRLELDKIV